MLTTAGAVRSTIGASDGMAVPSTAAGNWAFSGAAAASAMMAANAATGRAIMKLTLCGCAAVGCADRRMVPSGPMRRPIRRWSFSLDDLRASVDVDADPPRHDALVLGNHDFEHAVVALGGNAFGVGGVGQREAAEEAAGHALDAAIALAVFLAAVRAAARNGQHAVLHGDLDVVRLDARDVGVQQEAVLFLADVHRRGPVGDAAGGLVHAEALLEQPVQVFVHGAHQAPGLVADKTHGLPPVNDGMKWFMSR